MNLGQKQRTIVSQYYTIGWEIPMSCLQRPDIVEFTIAGVISKFSNASVKPLQGFMEKPHGT